MSTLGTALATASGMALITIALRDIFDVLFSPEGKTKLGRTISRSVWVVFRRLAGIRPGVFPLAGPVALVGVVATWAALLLIGWALILWPHFPDAFSFQGPRPENDLVGALQMSLVTMTTLGFGDVVPTAGWLRVVLPFEALLGFGLLSASVSWLLLIYPVLHRRRSLAYEISLLLEAERDTGGPLEQLEASAAEGIYSELTSRLVAVERDLVNFPISYYFAEGDERFALPAVAPELFELAQRGADAEGEPGVNVRARMLLSALDDLADTAARRFHGHTSDSTAESLRAYAADHLSEPDR
jgi:hypothetical protein